MSKVDIVTFLSMEQYVSGKDSFIMLPFAQEEMESHKHTFFELVYITNGTALHTMNGVSSRISKGNYFIVDYGVEHSYRQCENLTLINCLFLPEVIDETMRDCKSFHQLMRRLLIHYYHQTIDTSLVNHIFNDDNEKALKLLEGMSLEYTNREIGYVDIFRSRLLEIIILMMRKVIDNDVANNSSLLISELNNYVKVHYKESKLLHQFCKEYHYAEPYVSRKYREIMKDSFIGYLQKYRIEKSCELLLEPTLPITEVSNQVGYGDVKYFQNIFKKYMGMTPSQYRKLHKNKLIKNTGN